MLRGEHRGGRIALDAPGQDLHVDGARLTGVDLSGLQCGRVFVHDSTFEGCTFAGSSVTGAFLGSTGPAGTMWDQRSWPQSVYRDCDFTRVRLPDNLMFGNARFEQCLFDRTRLRETTSTGQAEFVSCTFRGRLRNITFRGRVHEYARQVGRDCNAFTGNDLTAATLTWVGFRNIDLRAQHLPGPPDHWLLDRIGERTTAALAAVDSWPDAAEQRLARWMLAELHRDADEYTDGYALVTKERIGETLPPERRAQVLAALTDYTHIQQ
ncbi:pentapeptide repeat-containing protein [Catellatospora coxensis]|uniref:pentapeptide repeat-containing protein n=1 Tax=Catellatospora coxensis TaxID=310354 RepID=UPI0019415DCB|nr:pentapeptide repeat-containing protein [Catellatospora coxensis]